jgi:hypothetical protein
MSFPTIEADDRAVSIELHGRRVHVDGSAHALLVTTPSGEKWEIGATRAGLGGVCGLVVDRLELPRLGAEDARAICAAVTGALRRAAAHWQLRAAAVERQVDAIRATPLTLSEPYLRADYLREDAARFRAARVAIANVEDDASDDATPEAAEALVERLARWRHLFASGGKAGKALNRTLTEYGEELSPEALWGFRHVSFAKAPVSRQHAEVIGRLGAHGARARLDLQMKAVQLASAEALREQVLRVERSRVFSIPPEQGLVELVAMARLEGKARLHHFVERGLELMNGAVQPDAPTTLPPIPLPRDPEIRFLRTFGEVEVEGRVMNHCVATRYMDALAGRAFLFSVESDGMRATVQVDERGNVFEARGPNNNNNAAVLWATWALERWGRGFWVKRFGAATSTWRQGRVPPTGTEPLRTVEDCYRVYRTVAEKTRDEPKWRWWLEDKVEQAALGRVWLVTTEVEGFPLVSVIDDRGRVIDHAREVLAGLVDDAPRVLRVA